MFQGSIPALITPLRNGAVDEKAFKAFVDWQIREGSSGLVPCGTTGESPTLSHEEHKAVVALCVEAAKGRVPVIAGAGSNSTDEAIDLARYAKEVGADAVLSVVPYYNKPSQEGMYQHFKAIAEAVDIPIFLYNVPGRTIVDMNPETMGRLAKLKNIVGVKDATDEIGRVPLQTLSCGKNFVQLCGEDSAAVGFNAQGGVGCISVSANAAPRLCADMQAATLKGDYKTAREINERLAKLHAAMFVEPSPGPAKYAVSLLGHCAPDVRLPVLPPTAGAQKIIREAMIEAGVLN